MEVYGVSLSSRLFLGSAGLFRFEGGQALFLGAQLLALVAGLGHGQAFRRPLGGLFAGGGGQRLDFFQLRLTRRLGGRNAVVELGFLEAGHES